jgi:hypothetical protein
MDKQHGVHIKGDGLVISFLVCPQELAGRSGHRVVCGSQEEPRIEVHGQALRLSFPIEGLW